MKAPPVHIDIMPLALVRVRERCVLFRYGRPWRAGEQLHLSLADAERLRQAGTVEWLRRVEPDEAAA